MALIPKIHDYCIHVYYIWLSLTSHRWSFDVAKFIDSLKVNVDCGGFVVQPAQWDSVMKQLNAEDVVKAFQKNTKKPINQKDLKHLVDALLKAMNYSLIMANAEVRSIVFEF